MFRKLRTIPNCPDCGPLTKDRFNLKYSARNLHPLPHHPLLRWKKVILFEKMQPLDMLISCQTRNRSFFFHYCTDGLHLATFLAFNFSTVE